MDTSKSYVRDGRIQQKPRGNYFLFSFLFGLALAFVIFVPFMIVDGGRFLFYGDFNVQQVPFYRIAHDAIRSGNIGWNHLTDLGVNFIGSYSFYLLGSPFFWLTIPFPGVREDPAGRRGTAKCECSAGCGHKAGRSSR